MIKSKHAFGSEANINSALEQGLIDAYDILFLKEGKIGWIDKDGNYVEGSANEEVVSEKVNDALTRANAYTDEKIAEAIAVVEF